MREKAEEADLFDGGDGGTLGLARRGLFDHSRRALLSQLHLTRQCVNKKEKTEKKKKKKKKKKNKKKKN